MSFGKLGAMGRGFGHLGALGKVGTSTPVAPSILIDFTANTATVSGSSTPITNLFSVTRASSEPTIDASGNWSSVSSNALAMTSSGLQIYQGATNLLLQSQAFTNVAWTAANTTATDNVSTAPDGTSTAGTITANGVSGIHTIQQALSLSAGMYTFSGCFKVGSGARYVQFYCGGGSPDGWIANLDTQTGAVFSSTGAGLARARSQALANGWYRFIVTFAVKGTQTAYGIGIVPALNSVRSQTSTNAGTINIWGFQIETGYSATPYIPTTAASASRAADNISITGALATAIASSAGTLVITTGDARNGQAATIVDSNGTALLGITQYNGCNTALGATLYGGSSCPTWESTDNTVAFGWNSGGGAMQVVGGPTNQDSVARTPSSTLKLGSTSGSSAFLNGTIKSITFYPAKMTFAQTQSVPARSFDKIRQFDGNPIIPYNTNANNTSAGDAPYFNLSQNVGGTYYALSQGNAGSGATGWRNIMVYSTTDYVTWTYVGLAWSSTPATWDDHYLGHPAIIKIGATWYAYYSGMNAAGTVENIGVATSTDFVNWTKSGSNPLITDNVGIPGIIKIGSTYILYAADRPSGNTISYYTSSDGLTWTRGGFAIQTVVGDWFDGNTRLNDPYVVLNSSGFYEMTFTIENFNVASPYTAQAIGYATSTDGITWTKMQAPILQGDGVTGSANNKYPGDALLFFNGAETWLYFAGVNSSSVAQGCFASLTTPVQTTKTAFLTTTGAGTWTVPSDFISLVSVECIGAGGGSNALGSGSEGGSYAKITSTTTPLSPGNSISIGVGAGGSAANGGDTWWNATSLANASSVTSAVAVAASGGRTNVAGTGGGNGLAAPTNVGTTTFVGGVGGITSTGTVGGGGGAAGPLGNGGNGGNGAATGLGAGGGGGNGGGSAGLVATTTTGGAGGDNNGGTGHGAGSVTNGANGTNGGGGGGAGNTGGKGGNGGAGTEWDATHGSGGGGGGGFTTQSPAQGGLYGGGGGGRNNGVGGQGLIVIKYIGA